MITYMPADEAVHGGRPFAGPVDPQFKLPQEDTGSVSLGFSFKLCGWVVADCAEGQVYAEGTPAELSEWLQEYCAALTVLEAEPF